MLGVATVSAVRAPEPTSYAGPSQHDAHDQSGEVQHFPPPGAAPTLPRLAAINPAPNQTRSGTYRRRYPMKSHHRVRDSGRLLFTTPVCDAGRAGIDTIGRARNDRVSGEVARSAERAGCSAGALAA